MKEETTPTEVHDYSWKGRINEWLGNLPKEKYEEYKTLADELEIKITDEYIDGCSKHQYILQKLVIKKLLTK